MDIHSLVAELKAGIHKLEELLGIVAKEAPALAATADVVAVASGNAGVVPAIDAVAAAAQVAAKIDADANAGGSAAVVADAPAAAAAAAQVKAAL